MPVICDTTLSAAFDAMSNASFARRRMTMTLFAAALCFAAAELCLREEAHTRAILLQSDALNAWTQSFNICQIL